MKLAIVGSRDLTDYKFFETKINDTLLEWNVEIKDIECVISGGARGADTLAEKWAKANNIKTIVFKPNWNLGRAAGILRNTDIVNECTHIIGFPSKNGRGTQDSMRKALATKKITKEFYID